LIQKDKRAGSRFALEKAKRDKEIYRLKEVKLKGAYEILGMAKLSEIIKTQPNLSPAEILDLLRRYIITQLNQYQHIYYDSMDIDCVNSMRQICNLNSPAPIIRSG
jgi:hypothetical protein